jgi:23S rRNA pseudouridine1911/1915/1917 synthase
MSAPFPILYEDNHLLAIVKPPGTPTMGVPLGQPSVLTIAQQYVKQRYNKPGAVYLGIVSRLDAPVSGVLLLARTSKAAGRLTEQFRTRTVKKTYWAVVADAMWPGEGECVDWIVHDERHRRVRIATPDTAGAKEARLAYRELRQLEGGLRLLEIDLQTGRKHQIRVQLAHRERPIVGDRKYGSPLKFPVGIALHARRLEFEHPVRKTPLELIAPMPPSWRRIGAG